MFLEEGLSRGVFFTGFFGFGDVFVGRVCDRVGYCYFRNMAGLVLVYS